MTKRLLILRHAKAMPSEGLEDSKRPLAPKGLEDSEALGKVMQQHKGYQPDLALCSPSVRTRQTLDGVLKSLAPPSVQYLDAIYDGTRSDLFGAVQNAEEKYSNILLVGHNPGIHDFAATLADDASPLFNRLLAGYKPGTLTVLECPCETWPELQPGQNRLIDVLEPLDYNAPATPARWT